MADDARKELMKSFKTLLETGIYSDLTITCGQDTHKVHKAIVCAQSYFFNRAETFARGTEAAEGTINLPEDDPATIKLLVSYFYTGEYEPKLPSDCVVLPNGYWTTNQSRQQSYSYNFPHTCSGSRSQCIVCPHHDCYNIPCEKTCRKFMCETCIGPQPPNSDATQLLLHAQMYEIGDKYGIQGLKYLCQEKFARACKKFWNDDQFLIAAKHALTTTPDTDQGLRNVLQNLLVEHPQLLGKAAIESLLSTHPGFAFGVVKRQAEQMARLNASR